MPQNANSNLAPQEQQLHSPYILSLDVGTSSTRALLYDATGSGVPHVVSQHTYALTTSEEGEVAVNPDMLVATVATTIDEALAAAGPLADAIGAVAADTFWHSLMGVDANGKPTTLLITWEDTRPRKAAEELRKELNAEQIHARTGAILHASYWPAKLRWLATTQPEAFARTAQWLSFGEYLQRQFLGRSVLSLSMASGTGLLLVHKRTWDEELLKFLGVRPDQLPSLADIKDSVKGLLPQYATRWPKLNTVPWFPAVGDGAAANIGSGAATIDRWALTVGTSGAIRVVVPPEGIIPPKGLWLYLVDYRRGLLGGALSEGGNMFAWMENTLRLPPLAEADTDIADIPPDRTGLTILPFISGERSLGWHADARAVVTGISLNTTPADLLRAATEALAYQLGAVFDALTAALDDREIAPMLIGSGGALLGSPTFQEVVADTLNTALSLSLEHETSARGAALLALESLGVIADVADVPLDVKEPILPNEEHHAIYSLAAERQQNLYKEILG